MSGTLKGHKRGVWSVEFSPVDKVLARCVSTAALQISLTLIVITESQCFSNWVYDDSAAGDKTIKLWSLTDMVCLKTFEGHTNSVLRVKFINHGMQLMSRWVNSCYITQTVSELCVPDCS